MSPKNLKEENLEELREKWRKVPLLPADEDTIDKLSQGYEGVPTLGEFFSQYLIRSNRQLKKWAVDNRIRGNGTLEDPYIIDTSVKIPTIFSLLRTSLHLSITQNMVHEFRARNCQNIRLKGCTFKKLSLIKSSRIIVENSEIEVLNVINTKNVLFTNTKISRYFMKHSQNATCKDCSLNSVPLKGDLIQNMEDDVKFKKFRKTYILWLLSTVAAAIFTIWYYTNYP